MLAVKSLQARPKNPGVPTKLPKNAGHPRWPAGEKGRNLEGKNGNTQKTKSVSSDIILKSQWCRKQTLKGRKKNLNKCKSIQSCLLHVIKYFPALLC